MLNINDKAPEFTLNGINSQGEEHSFSLNDLLKEGKQLVLYFYPKDNTPGCTQEACDFRDSFNRLNSKALVIGVSPDSLQSHKAFQEKQNLNFILLSDSDKTLAESYGVYGEKKRFGKVSMGIIRSTFIIGTNGLIKKIWKNVKVKGHVEQVLSELN